MWAMIALLAAGTAMVCAAFWIAFGPLYGGSTKWITTAYGLLVCGLGCIVTFAGWVFCLIA